MKIFFDNMVLGNSYFWATFAFFFCYFIPSSTGNGINVAAGLFLPGILFGCCIGYWIPLLLNLISNNLLDYNHMIEQLPTYALAGVASAITGFNWYTFSVAVFIMESSQHFNAILPCLIACIVSKVVADRLTRSHDWYSFFFDKTPIIILWSTNKAK